MGGGDLTKKVDKLESKISDLNQSIDTINSTLAQLQEQVNKISKNVVTTENDKSISALNETLESLEIKVNGYDISQKNLKHQCDALRYDLNVLKSQQAEFKERLIKQECQSRRDNLLFDGVPEAPPGIKETDKDCLDAVYKIMETNMGITDARNIRIVRCHRVGPPPKVYRTVSSSTARSNGASPTGQRAQGPRPRSIIIKLHWFGDRQRIWEARFKLQKSNIFINEDFPAEINQRRRRLYPIMKKAKDVLKMKAFLSVDKLHLIDSDEKRTVVDVNTLHRLPPQLDPRYITTTERNDCFAFFGELCPLSNFHPAPIVHGETKYANVEQMYQHLKAENANDQIAAKKIMEAQTPAECKAMGDRVPESNTWASEKEVIMKHAIFLKFSQNPKLKDFLMKIKSNAIAEASPSDLYWGTGVAFNRAEATIQNKWRGKNNLGKLLQELRETFK
jgi:ribA/ribD-fused uncharacterized protein